MRISDGVQTCALPISRKPNTDVSYQACARRLLDATDAVYPMFATHNAQTIAAVHHMARAAIGGARDADGRFRYEFQKLRSEEHTSELQSLMRISYAVFCLKKTKKTQYEN